MSSQLKKQASARRSSGDPAVLASRYWKQNLIFVWLSQFFAIVGFSFALPFAPLFIRELGVTEPRALNFWVAMFSGAAPVTLAIFSPIWGALADRYGRRIMLLRSYIGATILLLMMSRVQSVQMLIVMRLAQGIPPGRVTVRGVKRVSLAFRHPQWRGQPPGCLRSW